MHIVLAFFLLIVYLRLYIVATVEDDDAVPVPSSLDRVQCLKCAPPPESLYAAAHAADDGGGR